MPVMKKLASDISPAKVRVCRCRHQACTQRIQAVGRRAAACRRVRQTASSVACSPPQRQPYRCSPQRRTLKPSQRRNHTVRYRHLVYQTHSLHATRQTVTSTRKGGSRQAAAPGYARHRHRGSMPRKRTPTPPPFCRGRCVVCYSIVCSQAGMCKGEKSHVARHHVPSSRPRQRTIPRTPPEMLMALYVYFVRPARHFRTVRKVAAEAPPCCSVRRHVAAQRMPATSTARQQFPWIAIRPRCRQRRSGARVQAAACRV